MITDENKLHYVYIKLKTLTYLCVTTQKIRIKDTSASPVYSVLVVKRFL